MIARRRWFAGPLLLVKTAFRTFGALRDHRLAALIPFAAYLLVGALFLWIVNTVAPLAPFVYSLF